MNRLGIAGLVRHGEAMLLNGWTVQWVPDAGYRWSSPRGDDYLGAAADVPSLEAIGDAVANSDYETVPI